MQKQTYLFPGFLQIKSYCHYSLVAMVFHELIRYNFIIFTSGKDSSTNQTNKKELQILEDDFLS